MSIVNKYRYFLPLAIFFLAEHTNANTQVSSKTYTLHIVRQPIEDALIQLATQTGISVIIASEPAQTIYSQPIDGIQTIEEALTQLLGNTNYTFKNLSGTQKNSFIITPKTYKPTPPPPPKNTTHTSPLKEELYVYGKQSAIDALTQNHVEIQLGREHIELYAINNLHDIANQIPGIDVSNGTETTVYMHGVGINDNTDINDPLVATYLNGVPFPRLNIALNNWYDIERLEIEPGPQNHLLSQSTVGGKINIQYNAPIFDESYTQTEVTTGSYNFKKINVLANISTTPSYATRASFASYSRDSYFSNLSPKAGTLDHPGRIDDTEGRLQATIKLNQHLNLTGQLTHLKQQGTGPVDISLTYYLQNARQGNLNNPTSNFVFIPRVRDVLNPSIYQQYFVNINAKQDNIQTVGQLNLTYENNDSSYQWVLAQVNTETFQLSPRNKGPYFPYQFNLPPPNHPSQKLNEYDHSTQAMDEVFYYGSFLSSIMFSTVTWNTKIAHSKDSLYWFFGDSDDFGSSYIGLQYDTYFTNQLNTLYSEIVFTLNKKNTFTLGIRGNQNQKKRQGIGIVSSSSEYPVLRHGSDGFEWNLNNRSLRSPNDFNDPNEFDSLGNHVVNLSAADLLTITPREQWEAYNLGVAQWGTSDNIEAYVTQNYDASDYYIAEQNGHSNNKNWDWRADYIWQINAHLRNQISILTATSNPGFNDNIYTDFAPNYEAEKATALDWKLEQHGLKTRVSGHFFYHTYKNKIALLHFTPSDYFADTEGKKNQSSNLSITNDFRINIPKATSKGISFNINHKITPHLTTRLNALYLDATYTKGEIPDARMATYSNFTNADPLRFNTTKNTTTTPNGKTINFTHTIDAYKFTSDPRYQIARPGVDMNHDQRGSSYYQIKCPNNILQSCFSVLEKYPSIENPIRNIKGNQLPRSPKWDISAGIEYQKTLPKGLIQTSLSCKYRSTYYLTPYNSNGFEPQEFYEDGHPVYDEVPSFYDKVPAHITIDANILLSTKNLSPWSFNISIKNLTNALYVTQLNNTAWSYTLQVNAPRTYELTLKKSF